MAEKAPASPWLSASQAAEYLQISIDSIYDACATRGLRHSKIGHRTLRFRQSWLDEWVEQQSRVLTR